MYNVQQKPNNIIIQDNSNDIKNSFKTEADEDQTAIFGNGTNNEEEQKVNNANVGTTTNNQPITKLGLPANNQASRNKKNMLQEFKRLKNESESNSKHQGSQGSL